ncbi:MAG: S9 family peptidase [Dehalococcoidia bacterium]|nr:S9 family peptidase [Dehalococcoidia bacterium]
MSKRFTPEVSVELPSVYDAQVSPDGTLVAFVVADNFRRGGPAAPKMPPANIYSVAVDGGDTVRLTNSERSDTMPRWSPDGTSLAFLSDREEDGQRQIYLLPRRGGEARKLTNVRGDIPSPRSLSPMSWTEDGRSISFLKEDGEADEDRERQASGADQVVFEEDHRYMRLWSVDIESGETRCVSPDGLQIWEAAVSPDGTRVAAVVSDLPYEGDWYLNRLVVFEAGSDQVTVLYDERRPAAKPAWSPDGSSVAFLTSIYSDRGNDSGDLMLVPAAGGEPRNLTADHGVSDHYGVFHPNGEAILTATNVHGGSGISLIDLDSGQRRYLWNEKKGFSNFSRSSGEGAPVFASVIDDPDNLPEVFAGSAVNGEIQWTKLTDVHAEWSDLDIGETREVFWEGNDGTRIQGLLQLPPGYTEGRIPVAMMVHGGPTGAVRFNYQDHHRWAKLIADSGIAVFMPNYRGSTGWGLEFAESNLGDMGGEDFQDMLAGLDHLVETGIADGDRLGICGWSYGGFTSAWAVTQSDRFKAAVMGAGIADWRSFHGRSYLHVWDAIHYDDSDPYDLDSAHAAFSPINFIKNADTPTLVLHGEQDWDVPVEQGYQFFRALKDRGVDTRLVVYPREPHGVEEYEHQLDIARRVRLWFEERLLD